MVRSKVALAAGVRQASDLDRRGVASVAGSAGADCAIAVGPADTVARRAAARDGGGAFERHERIGRPFAASRVKLFAKRHLLG